MKKAYHFQGMLFASTAIFLFSVLSFAFAQSAILFVQKIIGSIPSFHY